MPGRDELTRVLRELFDRNNRTRQAGTQRSVVILKSVAEAPGNAERTDILDVQPSGSPKWADAPTWSRANDNILWSEGAQWD